VRIERVDSNAGNLIGYVTVITGLIVGLGPLDLLSKALMTYSAIAYFIGLGFLLGSAISALLATRVRTWHLSPTVEWCLKWIQDPELSSSKGFDHLSVLQRSAIEIGDAVNHNFDVNQRKALWLIIAWILLVIGIGALVAFLGIYASTSSGNNAS
jgi:hypothetical protein